MFVSEFVEQILDQFWDENFYKLLFKQFIPYLSCILSTFIYMQFALATDEEEVREE